MIIKLVRYVGPHLAKSVHKNSTSFLPLTRPPNMTTTTSLPPQKRITNLHPLSKKTTTMMRRMMNPVGVTRKMTSITMRVSRWSWIGSSKTSRKTSHSSNLTTRAAGWSMSRTRTGTGRWRTWRRCSRGRGKGWTTCMANSPLTMILMRGSGIRATRHSPRGRIRREAPTWRRPMRIWSGKSGISRINFRDQWERADKMTPLSTAKIMNTSSSSIWTCLKRPTLRTLSKQSRVSSHREASPTTTAWAWVRWMLVCTTRPTEGRVSCTSTTRARSCRRPRIRISPAVLPLSFSFEI